MSEAERMLKKAGFELARTNKHRLWRKVCANGVVVQFAAHQGSKADAREVRHARATIRRAEEGRVGG